MGLFKLSEDINDMFNNPQKRAMLEDGIRLLNEINNNQKEILEELKKVNKRLNELNEYRN